MIATWSGPSLAFYLDGGQVFANQSLTPPNFAGETKLYVGSTPPDGTTAASGQVTYLTVLNRAVSGQEVSQMFASGGPNHQ